MLPSLLIAGCDLIAVGLSPTSISTGRGTGVGNGDVGCGSGYGEGSYVGGGCFAGSGHGYSSIVIEGSGYETTRCLRESELGAKLGKRVICYYNC